MANISDILEKINFNITFGNINVNVFSLNEVDPNPEWFVPEHMHSDFEFHIIPKGKGYINIEGNDFSVNHGEFYVTGPMLRHGQTSDKDNPMSEYCLECEINIMENNECEDDFTYKEGVLLKEILSNTYPYAFKDVLYISDTFEEIFREAQEQKPGFLLRIQNLIIKIVLDLFKTICDNENIDYKYPRAESAIDSNRIQRLVKYIDANYKSNININDVSRVLLLSPRQINRLMKKTFNQTFHDYLLRYRMHVAEKLLMNTTLSIEDIADASGFSSHFYMYQVFKHRGKPTPGEFRNAFKVKK